MDCVARGRSAERKAVGAQAGLGRFQPQHVLATGAAVEGIKPASIDSDRRLRRSVDDHGQCLRRQAAGDQIDLGRIEAEQDFVAVCRRGGAIVASRSRGRRGRTGSAARCPAARRSVRRAQRLASRRWRHRSSPNRDTSRALRRRSGPDRALARWVRDRRPGARWRFPSAGSRLHQTASRRSCRTCRSDTRPASTDFRRRARCGTDCPVPPDNGCRGA